MGEVRVITTYLEMTEPGQLRPRFSEDPRLRVLQVTACPAYVYRDLYRGVGRGFNWHSRYHWTDGEIARNLADPAVSVHFLYWDGRPAGFFELRRHAGDDSVEVVYLGLLPEYVGRGLGRHLATVAMLRAWSLEPSRVWLHTCTLDHPAALPTYQAAGLVPYKAVSVVEPVLEP